MTYSEKGEPKEMKTVERVKLTELCELNMGQSPDSESYNMVGKGLPSTVALLMAWGRSCPSGPT